MPGSSSRRAIGQAVFDHLVNTLGALTRDLQPDAILLLQPDPLRGAQFRTIAAGGSGSIDPFLSSSSRPRPGRRRQDPARLRPDAPSSSRCAGCSACGSSRAACWPIRRVTPSSSGRARARWQARAAPLGGRPRPARCSPASRRPAPPPASPTSASPRSAGPAPVSRVGQPGAGQRLPEPRPELAFRIASAEPALASVSMTRSWEAFEKFRTGLEFWQRLRGPERRARPRRADHGDPRLPRRHRGRPNFALAHYRLGLALQKDRQPLAAAEALRNSLKANPGFVPARVALASVLYGIESRAAGHVARPRPSARARGMQPTKDAPARQTRVARRWRRPVSRPGAPPTGATRRCSRRREASGSPW